jgi:hypothetical protein
LQIDLDGFPDNAGVEVVNKGYIPRHRSLYAMVAKSAWLAQKNQLHMPVHLAKKVGVKRLISAEGKQSESLSAESRQKLLATFDKEILALETVLQTDLSHWRS